MKTAKLALIALVTLLAVIGDASAQFQKESARATLDFRVGALWHESRDALRAQ